MPITEAQYPVSHYYFSKLWIALFIWLVVGFFLILIATLPGVAGTTAYNPRTGTNNFYIPVALYVLGGFCFLICIVLFVGILSSKSYFHYTIDDYGITLAQGFSRKQQAMAYGVVKKVWVGQGPLDGMFGIATLYIRNEAGMAASNQIDESTSLDAKNILIGGMSKQDWMVASATTTSNTITIPGLRKQDAEALKDLIASKIIS